MGSEPRTPSTKCLPTPPEPRTVVSGTEALEAEGPIAPYLLRDSVYILWREVLNLMLEGIILPSKIAERLGTNSDLIRKVQNDTEFIRFYDAAKSDMAVSAIERVRA